MNRPKRNLQDAQYHFKQANKILTECIKELKKENELLRRKNGLHLNKTKAAQYLSMTPRNLYRLEKKFPHRLKFTNGQIAISELDAFEVWYNGQKYDRGGNKKLAESQY